MDPVETRVSKHARQSNAAWTGVDPVASVGGDDGRYAIGDLYRSQCPEARVPRRYRKRVTEKEVVIAVLLAIRKAGCAIAARHAGCEIARPQFRDFQAILPAEYSRLVGELAQLGRRGARIIGARVYWHCVSDLK